jgi:hypothetical protein
MKISEFRRNQKTRKFLIYRIVSEFDRRAKEWDENQMHPEREFAERIKEYPVFLLTAYKKQL